MHRIFRVKAYEMEHGPHFNEEHARKAVMKMENEDGTRGQHWSLEETSALASQYGISLSGKFNRYDWYVALNMVYSDYYKVLLNITGSNNVKHYVEFAKAWLNDKDIDEGKMWYYYQYVMCDKIREAEMECYEEELEKHEVNEESYGMFRRGSRGGRSRGGMRVYRSYPLYREEDTEDYDREVIMFYPFLNYFNRNRVRTVDNYGIPVLRTNYVTTDTTSTSVTYGLCPRIWRQLPCQGLFILHVTSTPASTATATDLVFLDPCAFNNRMIDNTATVITSTGAKALLNGSGTQMTNNEILTGNRYLIYYNKCDGIFQVINHIVTPATPAA